MANNLHQAQSHEILRSWQSQRNDINHHKDFVLPMFIGNDDNSKEPIDSMPDVYRYGCNRAVEYLEPLVYSFGLRAVLLFPVVTKSDQAKLANTTGKERVGVHDSKREMSSSNSSSNSSNTQSSSSETTSSDDDDDDDDERVDSNTVLAERLLSVEDTNTAITNSQNPFLNPEGEEAHLLGGESDHQAISEPQVLANIDDDNEEEDDDDNGRINPNNLIRNDKGLRQSVDVKLIKGMALKDKHNPVLRLIPKLRAKFPQLLIICDVCLCAFTSTGHCCIFEDDMQKPTTTQDCVGSNSAGHQNIAAGSKLSPPYHSHHLPTNNSNNNNNNAPAINPFPISNKITCQYLARLSVEYALRGCNVVAPSDMMDGRIATIRELLDSRKLQHVSILSYSAKFASAFYGPFRQATHNAPEFGDRRAYQLPPGSRAMAMKAVQRDIDQGADFLMVKPGCPYLDIVRDIRELHPNFPLAIYQVSGEYSMLKMAAKANVIDLKLAVNELLTSFRRAGATIIISYFTPEILRGEL